MTEKEQEVNLALRAAGREAQAADLKNQCEACVSRRVADTILEQLGGNKFMVMTGSKDFVADGNTLRMTLRKNKSGANRLFITLDGNDTYSMRFFHYTPGRMNQKTLEWSAEKIREIEEYTGAFADDLCRIFNSVTGLDTRL